MQSFTEAEQWLQGGRNKDSRTVANNTVVHRLDNGDIAVQLHATDVVTYHSDGSMTLRTGGYQTMTTKQRLTAFAPYVVSSVKGRWFISNTWSTMDRHIPFVDGITLDPSKPLPAAADTSAEDAANKATNKAIDQYVKGYTDEVIRELYEDAAAHGTAGDCWFCSMIDVPTPGGNGYNTTGESTSNLRHNEHLLNHLDEEYRMASLMRNALVAKGYINPPTIMVYDPGSVRRSIRTFLRKRLVSGAVATR